MTTKKLTICLINFIFLFQIISIDLVFSEEKKEEVSVEQPIINVTVDGVSGASTKATTEEIEIDAIEDVQEEKKEEVKENANTSVQEEQPAVSANAAQSNENAPIPQQTPAQPIDPLSSLKGLKGNFETDLFTGGGSFSYPFDISPGRNGMQPKLSLNYSTINTRIDSTVGYGWELNNSFIFRSTNKGTDKLYTQNEFTASLFGSTEELILINAQTGEYRPKIEGSFNVYTFSNNTWTAKDKKGTQYIFGSTASVRQDSPSDATKIYKWMLEKVIDTNGNYMIFTYTKDQGQIYPDTIRYTGNGGNVGIFEVHFNHGNRPTPVTMYSTAFGVTTSKRLTSVDMNVNLGSGYQTAYSYTLSYNDSDFRGLLTSIQLSSGTLTLPPTIFGYTNNVNYLPNGLLQLIQTPYGGQTTITYKPSTQYRLADDSLANAKLPFVIRTVESITTKYISTDTPKTTWYSYGGGHYYYDQMDAYKREYAGFHDIIITDQLGNVTKLYFHQSEISLNDPNSGEFEDHISKKGRIFREEKLDNESHLFQTTIRKWNRLNLGSERNFVYLNQEIYQTYDGQTSHRDTAIAYVYDSYGNLITETNYGEVTSNNDGTFTDIGQDKIITNIEYALNTTAYIVGLEKRKELKNYNNTVIGETKIYYDNLPLGQVNKGNNTKIEMLVSSPNAYMQSTMQYNTFGLVTSSTNPRNYTTTYVYDSHQLYPTTVTNAKNQSTSYEYNYAYGAANKMTDPNDSVSEIILDSLGRVTEKRVTNPTTPTQTVPLESYSYNTTNLPASITKTVYTGQTGIDVLSKVYVDGFGRTMQTRAEAEGTDTWQVTSFQYNEKGDLKKEYLPVIRTGSAFETIDSNALGILHEYDALAREVKVITPVGIITTQYDVWKKYVYDSNNKRKDFEMDAFGNLVSVKEYLDETAYSTTYTYNALKQLTKITDALGNVRNFTYDLVGKMLTQEDLHTPTDTTFGVWTYTYDNNGNVQTKKDPKNQVVTFLYDELDRVLTENFSGTTEVEITYTYDTGAYAKGKLSTVVSNDVSKEYGYDVFGRTVSEKKTIDGILYTTAFTYDTADNPLTLTYPDMMTVQYGYNTAGQLETVKKGMTDVITSIDYAPNGALATMVYANGITTTNTYDMKKMYRLTRKKTLKNTTKLQDLAYTFDPVGNISTIIDTSNTNGAKIANYEYDDLYRLKKATITGSANNQNYIHEYAYDILGNILSRTDASGAYEYAGKNPATSVETYANPHAVTKVGTGSYLYDRNGNLTNNGVWAHTWDYRDRLTSSTNGTKTINYMYDEGGNRVMKQDVTGNKKTMYVNQYFDKEGSDTKRYIYVGSMKIATDTIGGESNSGTNPACTPPTNGDWIVTTSCTFTGTANAPANVIVNASAVLTIDGTATLKIDMKQYKLLVKKDGGVLVKKGGAVKQGIGNATGGYTGIVYHSTDHLSGSNVDTDGSGTIIELQEYYPFGNVRMDEKTSSFTNDYKYTGKELDEDTNLYYYGARYYDASIGRFVSMDPMVFALPQAYFTNPQQWNSYSYVVNNPLKWIDPTGMYNVKTGEIEKDDTQESITSAVNKALNISTTWDRIAEVSFFQHDYGTTDPTKLVGQKTNVGTNVVTDITKKMDRLIGWVSTNLSFYQDSGNLYLGDFNGWFGNNGPFDLKNYTGNDPMSITFGNPSNRTYWSYIYNGELIRYDQPGNILAGYGAAFFGVSRPILYSAAGFAGIVSGINSYIKNGFDASKLSSGDDPVDSRYLEKGYCTYYKSNGCN